MIILCNIIDENAAVMENIFMLSDAVCEVASQWPKIAKECCVPQKMIDGITANMLLDI